MLTNVWQKFNALNARERAMIIISLFVVVWGSWDALFYTPLQKKQVETKKQLAALKTQLVAQQQAAVQLQTSIMNDPNADKKKQLLELKARYQVLQVQMQQLDKKFVPPSLMAKVLSDVLKKDQQLTLIKLETLPAVPLLEFKQQQLLYQHGLVLTFSGNYFATLNYLKSLESLPWNFVWDSIDYKVKTYPIAEITLHIYTISLEKDWLDV